MNEKRNGSKGPPQKIILLATDGSMPALAATKKAVQMASDSNSKIVAIMVNERSIMTPLEQKDEELAEDRYRGPSAFGPEVARRYGESVGVPVEAMMLPAGPLVASILKFSEEVKPDIIIMGNSGRSGWERVQLGSVAEGVMKHARYPVLITKGFHLDDLKDIVEIARGIPAKTPKEGQALVPEITLESLHVGRRLSVAVVAMVLFLVPYFGLGLMSSFYPDIVIGDVFTNLPINILWILLLFPLGWVTAMVFNRIASTYDGGEQG